MSQAAWAFDDHSNTVEGYFSVIKHGINGVYHQVHLKRYLAEFDFRYH